MREIVRNEVATSMLFFNVVPLTVEAPVRACHVFGHPRHIARMPLLHQPLLHRRLNDVLTSVPSMREADENPQKSGLYGDGPAFPNRKFGSSSESDVPCAVGRCQEGDSRHRYEGRDNFRAHRKRVTPGVPKRHQFPKSVIMLNFRSCVPSAHMH